MVRKAIVRQCLVVFLVVQLASCGTVLHPERRGQSAGRLDPAVVLLDAVGMLFFFVPGLVAFAVDFSNGTIYLPPDAASSATPEGNLAWQTLQVNPKELTSEKLGTIVSEKTGQTVHLNTGAYTVTKIERIEDVTPETIADLQTPAKNTRVFVVFRGTAD